MNHVEQAKSRVYSQYRNQPKAFAWLQILATAANEIETVAALVRASYDIETATTEQLDVIGRVVGISRYFSTGAVDNDTFRLILKSKIVKNVTDTTLDGVYSALAFIVGFSDMRIIDTENMAFSVEFYQPLTTLQRTVLTNFDIVPRPQGVRFEGFEEVTNTWRVGQPGAQCGGLNVQLGRYIGG